VRKTLTEHRAKYLTANEYEAAIRRLDYFAKGQIDDVSWVAKEPYDIPAWRSRFLAPLGIRPGSLSFAEPVPTTDRPDQFWSLRKLKLFRIGLTLSCVLGGVDKFDPVSRGGETWMSS
jgi:hypothetical protein